MLRKIISGGQTGADSGALYAGRITGLVTGGTAPKGWLTEDGPKKEFLESFGLVEHLVDGFPARTEKNVTDSTATIRFASDFSTAGERCTLNFCKKHDRPVLSVNVKKPLPSLEEVIKWLNDNEVEALNVAGNREKTCPGLCKFVAGFLANVIWEMKGTESRRFPVPELLANLKLQGESSLLPSTAS